MTNLEKNALRIAELMGWRYNPIFQQNTLDCNTYFADAVKISSNDELIELYSDYQGLMPIVFECNNSDDVDCAIDITPYEITMIRNDSDYRNYPYRPDYGVGAPVVAITEPEFIHAIQLAVIKYLELKNAR